MTFPPKHAQGSWQLTPAQAWTLTLQLALTLTLAPAAHAADHFCGQRTAHPIDKALGVAAERSGGVTVDLREAQSNAYAAWDKELNRIYAQALKAAGPARRDALRAAQRAWLAFDTAQGQWDAAVAADQGTSGALNVGGAALERRRARVCDLSRDLESLKDSE